eukprot:269653_1
MTKSDNECVFKSICITKPTHKHCLKVNINGNLSNSSLFISEIYLYDTKWKHIIQHHKHLSSEFCLDEMIPYQKRIVCIAKVTIYDNMFNEIDIRSLKNAFSIACRGESKHIKTRSLLQTQANSNNLCEYYLVGPTTITHNHSVGIIPITDTIEISFNLRVEPDWSCIRTGYTTVDYATLFDNYCHILKISDNINGHRLPLIFLDCTSGGLFTIYADTLNDSYIEYQDPHLLTTINDGNCHYFYFKFSPNERIFVYDDIVYQNITNGSYNSSKYFGNQASIFLSDSDDNIIPGNITNLCINTQQINDKIYSNPPICPSFNINECANSTLNNCHQNATCTDTLTGYTCSCNNELVGDGTTCKNVSELISECTTETYDNTNKSIVWIKVISCTEGPYDLSTYTYYEEKKFISGLLETAISIKFVPPNSLFNDNYNDFALIAKPDSNAIFALNHKRELSWTLDTDTMKFANYSDADNWIGSNTAKNRLMNGCRDSEFPRSFFNTIYQACFNGAGVHIWPDQRACMWDWYDYLGIDIEIYLGFELNSCEHSFNCNANAIPHRAKNGFKCVCNTGYVGNGVICEPIKICIDGCRYLDFDGIYIWSHFDQSLNASIYNCTSCVREFGPYLLSWHNEVNETVWAISTEINVTWHSIYAICTIVNSEIPCESGWFVWWNDEFVSDDDFSAKLCDPIDYCANSTLNNCNENAKCISTMTGVECVCNDGFVGNGITMCTEYISELSCDGIEYVISDNSSFRTESFPAGVCYTENGITSVKWICNADGSDILGTVYHTLNCSGEPAEYVSGLSWAHLNNYQYTLICCGRPCEYAKVKATHGEYCTFDMKDVINGVYDIDVILIQNYCQNEAGISSKWNDCREKSGLTGESYSEQGCLSINYKFEQHIWGFGCHDEIWISKYIGLDLKVEYEYECGIAEQQYIYPLITCPTSSPSISPTPMPTYTPIAIDKINASLVIMDMFGNDSMKNWYEAEKICQDIFGTNLAVVTDMNQLLQFTYEKTYHKEKIWIGLHDHFEQGVWTWIDGTTCNSNDEKCVESNYWGINNFSNTTEFFHCAYIYNNLIYYGDCRDELFFLCAVPNGRNGKCHYHTDCWKLAECCDTSVVYDDLPFVFDDGISIIPERLASPPIAYWNSTLYVIGQHNINYQTFDIKSQEKAPWSYMPYQNESSLTMFWYGMTSQQMAQYESSLYLWVDFCIECITSQDDFYRLIHVNLTEKTVSVLSETANQLWEWSGATDNCIVTDGKYVYVIKRSEIQIFDINNSIWSVIKDNIDVIQLLEWPACAITIDHKNIYIFGGDLVDNYGDGISVISVNYKVIKYNIIKQNAIHLNSRIILR